ncbi:hypothetical protein PN36_31455 [Candidatus Thiomargarita nelsonii]|uniref:Uncharacterized protein n=1 Tax=Candidatus Thiomargarita nelsonii TaxID=1003181 RepID=A0A0A6PBW2_9GAMM|nr:hypothetical protein PN36_31455 [Candidatus Thiomargarita nelsonii]
MLALTSRLVKHFLLFGSLKILSAIGYIRHPIMLGTIIGLWATPSMSVGHLMLAIGFTIYIFIGIRFEERDIV